MKKNFLFVLLLSISTIVSAQEAQQKSNLDSKLTFGVKGGYNLSSMTFVNEKLDSKSYFYLGGLVEYSLSSKVSLQGEVLYTQLGGKMSMPLFQLVGNEVSEMGTTHYDYQLSQIQVPISVKYNLIPNLSASVGMNLGWNISSKVKTEFLNDEKHDFEGLNTINLYPFLGAEYKIHNGLFVDARYNFNFIKMNEGKGANVKVGFLQAGIGYRFK
ncbi:porin family protein [Chryseobacterium polytrichastri]|uniref:Opacity protein n=1 Tax=Chryseobacterium polytrichastri TaxID=1302687 RepID=A0A1M7GQ80_9FLAO|nr:porin family protein [Chryseobacterium polytrichastri]SHM18390.1 Opacity protein [Chryseobacterium polytrichastri]